MPKITVINNEFVTLWYHEEKKVVHHQIHKFIYGKEMRELLRTGRELLAKHGATKWLSDDRGNSVVSTEDTEWAQANAVEAVRAGWKHWAVVRPTKVLGQMGMERIGKEFAEMGLNVQVFDDPIEAMLWLEKQ